MVKRIAFLLFVLVVCQNCKVNSHIFRKPSDTAGEQHKQPDPPSVDGNGDAHEGKGTFVNLDRTGECGDPTKITIKDQINLKDNAFYMVKNNCQNIPAKLLPSTEITFSENNPDILFWKNQLFLGGVAAEEILQNEITAAMFCRGIDWRTYVDNFFLNEDLLVTSLYWREESNGSGKVQFASLVLEYFDEDFFDDYLEIDDPPSLIEVQSLIEFIVHEYDFSHNDQFDDGELVNNLNRGTYQSYLPNSFGNSDIFMYGDITKPELSAEGAFMLEVSTTSTGLFRQANLSVRAPAAGLIKLSKLQCQSLK